MPKMNWLKGNLHTHTTNSDGDESPEHVAEWYHEHGYDWLCLSDHNHLTILEGSDADRVKWPFLVRGEEVTSREADAPVHVNGYGVTELVEASDSTDIVTAMRENVERIIAAVLLGQDIVDSGTLENGANRRTGDHTGTR